MAANPASAMAKLETAQAALQSASSGGGSIQPWSPELVGYLTLGVLGFSTLSLFVSAVLLWRAKAQADQVLRVTGVLAILAFSALLLVVGYSSEQLTPIIGLFGAIAGYLLGKETKCGGAP